MKNLVDAETVKHACIIRNVRDSAASPSKPYELDGSQTESDNPTVIPPFDDSGCLPPGVHLATLEEIDTRFGRHSELRRVQMESVRWMHDLALQAGVERIVLNGSFTTDIMEPNDVDCVLLFTAGQRRGREALKQLRLGLPFLEMKLVAQAEFDEYVTEIFSTDRAGLSKGMIEVIL